MLMVLLTLLAVGLLGISTIEVRKSGRESARFRAQANARLALSLAIGRLQATAGPDQRVTARADLDTDGEHRRWTGVWRSTRKQGNAELPVIRWDERESVLVDSRSSQTADDGFEGWLVSGDQVTPESPGNELATLVGEGSVNQADDQVKAPLVRIEDGENTGAYAFWVSDESMKASVNPLPAEESDEPRFLPVRYGIGALDQLSDVDEAEDESLAKVIDYRQAALVGTAGREAWAEHFHATGARASAVLSDPLRGGLKADLSAYFEQGGVPAKGDLLPAATDTAPLLGGTRRRLHGPKLGALRAFANLASKESSNGIKPAAALVPTRQDKFAALPKMSQFIDQPVHPVLAVAEIYTRFAYLRGYLTVHLYPRIVLWNPYNAPLASSTYTVDFNLAMHDSVDVEKRQQTITKVVDAAFDTFGNNKDRRMSFTLEATAFEPGEALVFSPKPSGNAIAGKAIPLALRTSGTNTLSASADPQELTNFYVTLNQLSNQGVTASDLPLYANHNDDGDYWMDTMDWWEGNPDNGMKISLHLGSAANHTARLRLPLLQLVDMDNWRRAHEGRYNNGRWRVGGVEPIHDYEGTPDLEPWARGCYGFRYKWWVEKNPYNYAGRAADRFWQASVTADYNLRAAFCHRSPFDAGTDNGENHHWYIWGPYAVDSQQGLPALSPERASHSGKNGFRGNPFFGGANSRPDHVYPLFDLPQQDERIVSLGRFQHAQLTPYLWHPTYAVGGSWVPPNQKTREKSGDTATQMTAAWTGQLPWLPAWMKQDRGRDEVVFDLSYESNHELWDRYFLSGATKAEKENFGKDAVTPLANFRLYPASTAVDSERLADFHQAGSELLLGGAFNVNSTEPGAWRALFASMRDSSFDSENAAFPRFLRPDSAEHKPDDPYDPAVWKGFRSLDDSQLASLADEMVAEVKRRGPFLSVSDFVNRRLVPANSPDAETGMAGALQQAIDRSGLNDGLKGGDLSPSSAGHGQCAYDEVGSNAGDWAPIDHVRESKGAGLPTYLQQGDLLQALGSFLVARGDTFVVRAYGEARTTDGKQVEARAWCEAEVQRLPGYVNAADAPEQPAFTAAGAANPALSAASQKFGRRFTVVSFRWLSPKEV